MKGTTVLTREQFESLPRQLMSRPCSFKAETWRVDGAGGTQIVKDVRSRSVATRWLARWLLRRELRALARLEGLERVPRVLGRIDGDACVLSWTPGQVLVPEIFRQRPREITAQLRRLIDEMHALGVFHLDLHQRRNLVLDEEGMLCVIDFGAAVVPSAPVRFALGWLLRWIDRHAAVRLLARFTPDLLSRAEARHMLFYGVVRRLWPFTSHRRLGEQGAKKRLQTLRSERPRAG